MDWVWLKMPGGSREMVTRGEALLVFFGIFWASPSMLSVDTVRLTLQRSTRPQRDI